jgi:hypothetical protein
LFYPVISLVWLTHKVKSKPRGWFFFWNKSRQRWGNNAAEARALVVTTGYNERASDLTR